MTPLGVPLVDAVQNDPCAIFKQAFWEQRPDLEVTTESVARGMYCLAYFDANEELTGIYIGLSEDLHLRAAEHAAMLANTMLDVGIASLH